MTQATIVLAMPESLVRGFFPEPLLVELRGLGDVRLSPTPSDHSTIRARALFSTAEVIITGWGTPLIDGPVLDAAPRLRAVVHSAGSVRAIVSKDCYDRGVAVSSQAWANAVPVAQYSLAVILLAAKGALRAQRLYRSRRAPFDVQGELAGWGVHHRRVGIIGASTIGRMVIDLLRPFEMDVVVADPTITSDGAAGLGVGLVSLGELMATCEVVSVHAPLLPGTAGMIDAALLASLRDGATFINTARGALVDQQALIDQLRTGRIEAVLDVTDPEVPDSDSPLWDLPNLMLTPHVAGAAGSELSALGASAVAEVARVLRGEPLRHAVTRERYDATA